MRSQVTYMDDCPPAADGTLPERAMVKVDLDRDSDAEGGPLYFFTFSDGAELYIFRDGRVAGVAHGDAINAKEIDWRALLEAMETKVVTPLEDIAADDLIAAAS